MSFLIGVAPVPPHFEWSTLIGISCFLAALLAIAVVVQVVTTPRSDHEVRPSDSSHERLGPAA